jgi:hypothetical protein
MPHYAVKHFSSELFSLTFSGGQGTSAQKPVLKQGISVEMAVASHAIEMRAADEQNAVVVAITRIGRVFVRIEPT